MFLVALGLMSFVISQQVMWYGQGKSSCCCCTKNDKDIENLFQTKALFNYKSVLGKGVGRQMVKRMVNIYILKSS